MNEYFSSLPLGTICDEKYRYVLAVKHYRTDNGLVVTKYTFWSPSMKSPTGDAMYSCVMANTFQSMFQYLNNGFYIEKVVTA